MPNIGFCLTKTNSFKISIIHKSLRLLIAFEKCPTPGNIILSAFFMSDSVHEIIGFILKELIFLYIEFIYPFRSQ